MDGKNSVSSYKSDPYGQNPNYQVPKSNFESPVSKVHTDFSRNDDIPTRPPTDNIKHIFVKNQKQKVIRSNSNNYLSKSVKDNFSSLQTEEIIDSCKSFSKNLTSINDSSNSPDKKSSLAVVSQDIQENSKKTSKSDQIVTDQAYFGAKSGSGTKISILITPPRDECQFKSADTQDLFDYSNSSVKECSDQLALDNLVKAKTNSKKAKEKNKPDFIQGWSPNFKFGEDMHTKEQNALLAEDNISSRSSSSQDLVSQNSSKKSRGSLCKLRRESKILQKDQLNQLMELQQNNITNKKSQFSKGNQKDVSTPQFTQNR